MQRTSSPSLSLLSKSRRFSRRPLSLLSTTTAPFALAALFPLLLPACASPEASPPDAVLSSMQGLSRVPGLSPAEHQPSFLIAAGAEKGLDAPLVRAPVGLKTSPAVAFAAGVYLVVWEDHRERSPLPGPFDTPEPLLFMARVAPDGAMLDAEARLLGRGQLRSVAGGSSQFLVAYKGTPDASCSICAVRVDVNGLPIDIHPRAVVGGDENFGPPTVASNGGAYLAAWPCGTTGICTRGILPSGTVNPAAFSVALHPDPYDPDPLRLASDGNGFLLATWTAAGLAGVRLNALGEPLGAPFYLSPPPSSVIDRGPLALAFDGTNYVVAWSHRNAAGAWPVSANRVSPAGTILGASPLVVAPNDHLWAPAPRHLAAVAHAGITSIFWEESEGDHGPLAGLRFRVRVSAAGNVLDTPTPVGEGRALTLASDGYSDLLVSLVNRPEGFPDPFTGVGVQRVSPLGALLDATPRPVARGKNAQISPAVAWNGQHYLAVWADSRVGQHWSLYGARLSPTGALVDTAAFPFDTSTTIRDALDPRVAFDGTGFRTVWRRTGDGTSTCDGAWTTATVDAQGTPSEPTPLFALSTCWSVFLGAHATGALATGALALGSNEDGDVDLAIPLDPETGPGTPVSLTISRPPNAHPAGLSFDGTNYLALWSDGVDLEAARLTPAGEAVDTETFPVSGAAALGVRDPAAIFDGENHLVAWATGATAPTAIRLARVSPAGTLLGPGSLLIATLPEACVSHSPNLGLSHDGERVLLTYQVSVSQPEGCFLQTKVAEVDTTGHTLSLASLNLLEEPTSATALASAGAGQSLLLQSRYLSANTLRTHRIRAHVLTGKEGVGGAGGTGSVSGVGGGDGGYCHVGVGVGGTIDPSGVGGGDGGSAPGGVGGAGGGAPGTPSGSSPSGSPQSGSSYSGDFSCRASGVPTPGSGGTFSLLALALSGLLAARRAPLRASQRLPRHR